MVHSTRIATVVSSTVMYGMARMWSLLGDSTTGEHMHLVFRDIDAASEWLAQDPTTRPTG